MRTRRPLVVALLLLAAGAFIIWQRVGGSPEREAERAVAREFDDSSDVRRQNIRCVALEDALPWEFACTFQEIRLNGLEDRPLALTGVDVRGGHLAGGTGVTTLALHCASKVRCWVRRLCQAVQTVECPKLNGMDFPTLGPNAPPRPLTAEACVGAWNAHGGFASTDPTFESSATPPPGFAGPRPVYTPRLAAASLGFIARRAHIRVSHARCLVTFDLSPRHAYTIESRSVYAPRFWTWAGRRQLARRHSDPAGRTACQRADGTLSLGDDCPEGPAGVVRDIPEELEKGVLQRVADMGGYPYWLGPSFRGGMPEPRESGRDSQAIAYDVHYQGRRLTLLVVTSLTGRLPPVEGVSVIWIRPMNNPVQVIANLVPPAGLTREVHDALRPFLRDDPEAPQLPGDLAEEPTRINTSVPTRTYGVGSTYKGLRATVVGDAPPGVGLVRFGQPGSARVFYLATYLPMKKTRCGRKGCVSPPLFPAALKPYGERRDTLLQDEGWIVDYIAPPGSVDLNGTQMFDRLGELGWRAELGHRVDPGR
jgi:hypothetical protein